MTRIPDSATATAATTTGEVKRTSAETASTTISIEETTTAAESASTEDPKSAGQYHGVPSIFRLR